MPYRVQIIHFDGPSMPPFRTVLALVTVLAVSACATAVGTPPCAPGEQAWTQELLYFGTARPDGTVSATEWAAFLDAEVTPRFPDGLTGWPASGQWRGADGALVREHSHVLNLLHPGGEAPDAAIRAVVGAYKARFQQEAVLRVRALACVSF